MLYVCYMAWLNVFAGTPPYGEVFKSQTSPFVGLVRKTRVVQPCLRLAGLLPKNLATGLKVALSVVKFYQRYKVQRLLHSFKPTYGGK